jgi:iron(III) transport system ATP-binding protein
MLEVSGLTKVFTNSYDRIAGGIRDATFSLPSGTFFTLLGPSGCGKTTTLRCIAGLERPDKGRVDVEDRVLFDSERGVSVPMNHRNIGMVFQSYAIWPHMTVFENVAFPLRVSKQRKYASAEIGRLVEAALETVDLGGYGDRPATKLSGGQQQRVALARAIVGRPKLLLLDEPLSNLDAALREDMRSELKRLQRQIGITTVYVTHDQAEALAMSDQIAVIDSGRVVQLAAPKDIYFRPANEFVARFIGSTNLIVGRVAKRCSKDELSVVRLSDGVAISCLFPAGAAAGMETVISVRPESMLLASAAQPVPDGHNALGGTVRAASFLGSTIRYDIEVGGQTFKVMAGPESTFELGSAVRLIFAPRAAVAVERGGSEIAVRSGG